MVPIGLTGAPELQLTRDSLSQAFHHYHPLSARRPTSIKHFVTLAITSSFANTNGYLSVQDARKFPGAAGQSALEQTSARIGSENWRERRILAWTNAS